MKNEPRNIRLSRTKATEIIRNAAQNSSLVFITNHALDRMEERGITATQINAVLGSGRIVEGPTADLMKGNWQCTVTGFAAGETLKLAIAIENDQNGVIVITVMWI